MKKVPYILCVLCSIFIAHTSCRKSLADYSDSTIDSTVLNGTAQIPFPQNPMLDCAGGPDYGDSIVFTQPVSGSLHYYISPVNNPAAGTYFSWPQGLVINSTSGTIDLTASQSGERYTIGFVKAGSTDTCVHTLMVGGSSYIDSIYVMETSTTTATPYFNANPNVPSPCVVAGACNFEGRQHLKIDNQTGMIDLKKSLDGGIFGLVPYDGETILTTIKYNIHDGSNNANQQMQIKLIYYNRRSDIPTWLLNEIDFKRGNILSNGVVTTATPAKPPLIIVTRMH